MTSNNRAVKVLPVGSFEQHGPARALNHLGAAAGTVIRLLAATRD
jgi:creatinine amidohydrolase/Fe(II)-dependent formamide hydrolase-like protein